MTFLAPGWFAVLPLWGMLLVYLSRVPRAGAVVPFLQLWSERAPTSARVQSARRSRLFVLLAMAAMLGAIFVAADPIASTDLHQTPLRGVVAAVLPAVSISNMAARRTVADGTQIMLTIQSNSPSAAAMVRLGDGATRIERRVEPAPNGFSRNEFFEIPGLSETITAEISLPGTSGDERPIDRATLTRRGASPLLEARTALPVSVDKFVSTYGRLRAPSDQSIRVAVTQDSLSLPEAGVIVVATAGQAEAEKSLVKARPTLTVVPDAITRDVQIWPEAADAQAGPPEGFRVVVGDSGHPRVAVREAPARKVWVNLDCRLWSQSPDFVIFFSNVFKSFAGETAYELQRGTETFAAAGPNGGDLQPRFRFTSMLCIFALALATFAAMFWPRQRVE